jgi:lysophospholipase L1-like esterase
LVNRGFEEWTYGYVDSKKNVVGLKIDWSTMTATVPPDSEALKDQLTRHVLYQASPQTGHHAAFRRRWFGRLIDYYRGTPTKIVFVRLPRGPIPRPDYLVRKKSSSIREFASQPGVLLADEHAFDSLETPELFKDAFHLNDAGCSRLSVMMAQVVSRLVR